MRGDILYAELGAAVGSEQAGFRPVVVVQNDVGNRYSPTVVVAPLTSNIRKNILPTHVHVGRESGVRPSLVLLEQLRTVDKCRLGDKIGHVNKSVMRRLMQQRLSVLVCARCRKRGVTMNVELNAFVVIDDWQAVVNRTVANYFDSLGFEHLDQVLEMRVFDLLNMNLLDAVRVEEIIVCLYRSLNPNITVDEAMYCGAMNQCFDYTGWRKIHRQLEKITVRDLVLTENINLRAIQHFYDAIRKEVFQVERI